VKKINATIVYVIHFTQLPNHPFGGVVLCSREIRSHFFTSYPMARI